MPMIPRPEKTIKELSPAPGNMNVYEYFLACTGHIDHDYPLLQFMGNDCSRAEFLADVDSIAAYFRNELKLEPGEAFVLFTPNTIEEVVMLFALNKIGCIAYFLHPLLPSDVMKASVEYARAKGISILDAALEKHADV